MGHGVFHISWAKPPFAGALFGLPRMSFFASAGLRRPFFILRSVRRLAAWVMLLVMLANFLAEGFVLFRGPLDPLREAVGEFVSGVFSPPPADPMSCCASKEVAQTSACGCTCCGDGCPMGDACTCSADGRGALAVDGLFFQMPRCHSDRGHAASHVPLSLRLVFVLDPAAIGAVVSGWSGPVETTEQTLISWIHPPPVPPPRKAWHVFRPGFFF